MKPPYNIKDIDKEESNDYLMCCNNILLYDSIKELFICDICKRQIPEEIMFSSIEELEHYTKKIPKRYD